MNDFGGVLQTIAIFAWTRPASGILFRSHASPGAHVDVIYTCLRRARTRSANCLIQRAFQAPERNLLLN
jgi:hypothetical protein